MDLVAIIVTVQDDGTLLYSFMRLKWSLNEKRKSVFCATLCITTKYSKLFAYNNDPESRIMFFSGI